MNIYDYFGNWINDVSKKNIDYISCNPNFIVIENFFKEEFINKIYEEFPENYSDDNWKLYCNVLEYKYANNNIDIFDKNLKLAFDLLGHKDFIEKMCILTGIHNLENDPYLNGAGIHSYPKFGRLNLHLDYEKHPILDKQRRVNIILYLSKDWKNEWNGDTEIWSNDLKNIIISNKVKYNSAIIFQTNEISWHGLTKKINCPENVYRKSLAYYYISDIETKKDETKYGAINDGYRTKASFIINPNNNYSQDINEKIEKLIRIRMSRRIEKEDIENIWSDWNFIDY